MKRSMITILAVLVAASLGFAPQTFAADKKIFLTLASGSPGGAYYPLGGGMSVVIQKTVEDFRCAAESHGGLGGKQSSRRQRRFGHGNGHGKRRIQRRTGEGTL